MTVLFYLGFGVLSAVGYVYRRRIFWWLFSVFWYLARLYINYKLSNKRKHEHDKAALVCVGKQEITFGDTTFIVYEYLKDSMRIKVFACWDEEPTFEHIQEVVEDNLIFKHNVLNCSINEHYDDENCLLDVTNCWRECLYHYQGRLETSKLKYFFNYIGYISGIQNLKDKYLVTYVNDDSFSEHKYKIADIWDSYFYEINAIGSLEEKID